MFGGSRQRPVSGLEVDPDVETPAICELSDQLGKKIFDDLIVTRDTLETYAYSLNIPYENKSDEDLVFEIQQKAPCKWINRVYQEALKNQIVSRGLNLHTEDSTLMMLADISKTGNLSENQLSTLSMINDAVLQCPKTDVEFTVYRGQRNFQTIGKEIVFEYVKSASFNIEEIARGYLGKDSFMMKIIIPRGSILGYHPFEDQVIFPNNAKFKVLSDLEDEDYLLFGEIESIPTLRCIYVKSFEPEGLRTVSTSKVNDVLTASPSKEMPVPDLLAYLILDPEIPIKTLKNYRSVADGVFNYLFNSSGEARNGYKKCKLLLNYGIMPILEDALDIFAQTDGDGISLIKALLEAGADSNIQNPYKKGPITYYYILNREPLEKIEALIRHGIKDEKLPNNSTYDELIIEQYSGMGKTTLKKAEEIAEIFEQEIGKEHSYIPYQEGPDYEGAIIAVLLAKDYPSEKLIRAINYTRKHPSKNDKYYSNLAPSVDIYFETLEKFPGYSVH